MKRAGAYQEECIPPKSDNLKREENLDFCGTCVLTNKN